MAVTSKILQWLLDGGKGIEEFKLLADAMETMSDARLIFEVHDSHIAEGWCVEESCDELCAIAREILDERAYASTHHRTPMARVFYVYHHIGKASGEVFYVGKGKGDRCRAKKGRSSRWIARADAEGGFHPVIVREGMNEAEALAFEQKEIDRLLALVRLENIAGVNVL